MPRIVCGDLLAESSYVVENLREWAREEFQPNCHPVTLTLYRAATVLEKLSAAVRAERSGSLHTAIGIYRAALDDIDELERDESLGSYGFGCIARLARGINYETQRAHALHDARGMIIREGATYRADSITPWLLRRSVSGSTNQVDLVISGKLWRTGSRRSADKAIRSGKWKTNL